MLCVNTIRVLTLTGYVDKIEIRWPKASYEYNINKDAISHLSNKRLFAFLTAW